MSTSTSKEDATEASAPEGDLEKEVVRSSRFRGCRSSYASRMHGGQFRGRAESSDQGCWAE